MAISELGGAAKCEKYYLTPFFCSQRDDNTEPSQRQNIFFFIVSILISVTPIFAHLPISFFSRKNFKNYLAFKVDNLILK